MDFEARLYRESKQRIPPRMSGGYPPMVVHYYCRPPVILGGKGLPRMPAELDLGLLDSARQVGAVADFLVIPSNGPHLLQAEIERAAGRKVLSIIAATLDEVRRRGWKRVGVVGVGDHPAGWPVSSVCQASRSGSANTAVC